MRKELGDDQIRITVRLPRQLYEDFQAEIRQLWGWGGPGISYPLRCALQHFLACPERWQHTDMSHCLTTHDDTP
jgi:hypothetical protein